MFQRLLTHPRQPRPRCNLIRAIVIAPTRELAVQIHNDAQVLGKHTGLKLAWSSAAWTTKSSGASSPTASTC
jgi:superfamily II DNA/RNA helicase